MSLARDLDRWEQPALLGPTRAQVARELSAVQRELEAADAQSGAEGITVAELHARALLRLAEIARLEGALPLDLLARAGSLAATVDRPRLLARIQLFQVRVLASAGRLGSARSLLAVVQPVASATPGLGADLGLAAAATGHPDARRMWLDGLDDLKRPSRDADRLESMVGAADASLAGGDSATARTLYRGALDLAEQHHDIDATLMLALRLGTLLLELGQPIDAAAPLQRALELGHERADSLVVVTAGLLLGGLALGREDWPAAEACGLATLDAGRVRRAWLAVADGAMTTATALAQQGRLEEAVGALLQTADELRGEGATAAQNLLKARLAELRHDAGADAFDEAMRAAMRS